MKFCSFAAIAVSAAVLAIACANSAPAQETKVRWNAPPEEWQWVVESAAPGCKHETIKSKAMDREVGYNVFLPPGYDEDGEKRYPVVYFLHGAGGNERSDADPSTPRRLMKAGKIAPAIYVYPNGGQFSKYRDWPDANVKTETMLVSELIPHIDETYRTIASREGRAISGWSMGGDGSLRLAMKYPETFCAVASLSAAVDWDAPKDDSVVAFSDKNVEKIRGRTGLLMVVGEDDRLLDSHQRLLPHLDELKIEYTFHKAPGVGHNLGEMKKRYAEEIAIMLDKHLASPR